MYLYYIVLYHMIIILYYIILYYIILLHTQLHVIILHTRSCVSDNRRETVDASPPRMEFLL